MYIKRAMEERIQYLSEHFPVVMICGARQVGKTTLLKKITENKESINYISLDNPRIRQLAQEDPELLLRQYNYPLIIDEIQYAPSLFTFIKIYVDEIQETGMYYITGSQIFHMMKNVSESLAGRVGIMTLFSLSRAEIENRKSFPFNPARINNCTMKENVSDIFDRILNGGMPRIVCDKGLLPETYFSSYVQTYIERDIRDMVNIKNERRFLKFISCMAARTSSELNLSDIAKDVEIDRKTAEGWLSILVTSGLVILISPYSGNTIKRIVKRPKIYFMDTGLACYLSMWNNARSLEVSAMAGAMFENYVVSEIVKSYANSGIDYKSRLFYYRDNNGKEIDLMILENGKIHPIEIKKSADPGKNALKNFTVLESLSEEIGEGCILCMSSMVIPVDSMNKLIPITSI